MRVVIDTNVVFEGLSEPGSGSGLIISLWLVGLFEPCVSTALAYEYVDVIERKFSQERWLRMRPVLRQMFERARYVEIHFSWRPISPDPGDDLVIDCAINANATVVTHNVRDFRLAQQLLGLTVMTPAAFLEHLHENLNRSRS